MFLGKKRNPVSQAALEQNTSHIKINKAVLGNHEEQHVEDSSNSNSNNKKLIDKYFSKTDGGKTKVGVGYDAKSKPKIHEASTEELKYKILDRYSEKKKKSNPKHLTKKKTLEDYDASSSEEEEAKQEETDTAPTTKKRKVIKQEEETTQPDEEYLQSTKSKRFGMQQHQQSSTHRNKLKQFHSIADELVAQSQNKKSNAK